MGSCCCAAQPRIGLWTGSEAWWGLSQAHVPALSVVVKLGQGSGALVALACSLLGKAGLLGFRRTKVCLGPPHLPNCSHCSLP
jgi:hypothetical protein